MDEQEVSPRAEQYHAQLMKAHLDLRQEFSMRSALAEALVVGLSNALILGHKLRERGVSPAALAYIHQNVEEVWGILAEDANFDFEAQSKIKHRCLEMLAPLLSEYAGIEVYIKTPHGIIKGPKYEEARDAFDPLKALANALIAGGKPKIVN